jgi:dipeptidyl aminopeptidase/acylaminoacyl peptidase
VTTIPLIPRRALFGNPDKASVQISPNGLFISYLAPLDGIMNVWVAPRDQLNATRPMTRDTRRGIRFYRWAFNNDHLLFGQDSDGDENWHLYSVGLADGVVKELTSFPGVQARLEKLSPKFPNEAVVSLNNRDLRWHDLYRVDLRSGASSLLLQNPGYGAFFLDDELCVRLATRMTPEGGLDILAGGSGNWAVWDRVPPEDAVTTRPLLLDRTGGILFMRDSRGRNTSALVARDLVNGDATVLAEDPRADLQDVLYDPREQAVQAASFVYDRKHWVILEPSIAEDMGFLHKLADCDVEIPSRSFDGRYWIVLCRVDNGPVRFYLYDRQRQSGEFLFTNRAVLERQPLATMRSTIIRSRDGLDLVSYYTLPYGQDRPLPMVLIPHGGPYSRDFWGFNSWHQWLANRGYAVMSTNFRGSTGFGKAFTNAGDLEWGGKILNDQIDAVLWAIAEGIADRNKVAIMGASFGGYSALAGLTFTPEFFACGIDIVGPSNLVTLLQSIPPYWQSMLEMFTTRVGDHRTEEGKALLSRHSPLTYTSEIKRPLLIGHGANDPRVKQAESDQIVQAMRDRHIPVTYVVYPDEGHGFVRPANSLSFNAIAEAFLAKYLGGRVEPIGHDLSGASLTVPEGIEVIPGLKEAMNTPSDCSVELRTGWC